MKGALFAALAALAGCSGPDNSLEGSIGESFSLDFDRVAIYKQDQVLRIEYLREVAGATNKVCKIVVDTVGLSIGDESVIEDELFRTHVTVQRIANEGGDFPPVQHGKITFETYEFESGGQIDGDFECLFDNGRTLSGTFDSQVEEVATN
jgi:hypothetical protein